MNERALFSLSTSAASALSGPRGSALFKNVKPFSSGLAGCISVNN